MKKKLAQYDIFYGWYIVAAGFIIMSTSWVIVYNCSSLFIKPISDDLGFTRSQISATMTIRAAFQMIIALLSGKIFRRYNIKRLMQIATIALFISFFSYSFVSSLIMFYILSAISSISVSLMSILPLAIIINNWFNERRGLAIGIAFMGSGVGGMILGSLVGGWIVSYGWRSTHQILATIMILCSLPCISFIIRMRPEEIGLSPLGGDKNILIDGVREEQKGVMLAEALKTNIFWGIIMSSVLLSLSLNTLMMSISPHLTDIGYTITFSANIVALANGFLAMGKLLLGKLYDSLGIRIATTASCVAGLVGLLGLVFADYSVALIAIILGVGLGCAFGTIANPIIAYNMFGKKDYGSINGVLQSANGMGGVIGPILTGYLYDRSGNYISSFSIMIVIIILVIIMYQFVFSRKEVLEV